jgi:hypothetical protein
MSMPALPSGSSNKAWLSKPENRTTAIFLVIMGIGAFMLWGAILPFILTVLDNTLEALWHGAVIVACVWVVFSKRVHKMARVINRWITGWFVSLDPIGIREDQIVETKKRKARADEAIGSVRGLRDGLGKRMTVNKAEYDLSMKRLKAAQALMARGDISPENKNQCQRTMLKDAPYSSSLEQLLGTQAKQMDHYNEAVSHLTRLSEFCDDVITRKEQEIRIEKDNLAEAKGLRTVRMAMSDIFGKGTGADQEMDDMAREQLEQSYRDEMGRFDQFLALTTDVIAKADFNNLAALQDVQGRMDQWSANNTGAPKQISSAAVSLANSAKQPESVTSDYFK